MNSRLHNCTIVLPPSPAQSTTASTIIYHSAAITSTVMHALHICLDECIKWMKKKCVGVHKKNTNKYCIFCPALYDGHMAKKTDKIVQELQFSFFVTWQCVQFFSFSPFFFSCLLNRFHSIFHCCLFTTHGAYYIVL